MGQVASYQIAREPDVTLGYYSRDNGWSLLKTSESAIAITKSPAGLLLTASQVQSIAPLAAMAGQAPNAKSVFDPLYDSLQKCYAAQDFAEMAKVASGFLDQHPIVPGQGLNEMEDRVRRFFCLRGTASSSAERVALIEAIPEESLAAWRRSAHSRIDIEKAQILATAASGIKPPSGVDLIGGLHAELAFATLDACYAAMPKRDAQRKLPNGYIDAMLDLQPYLPPFLFDLEICKTRHGNLGGEPIGILAGRLDRLKSYEAKMRTVTGAVTAGKGKEHAAGTIGHTQDCNCTCDDRHCVPIDPCCGEIIWYVTELLTLKDRTWCYKPSDIAYIENVAPYEMRIRTHGFTRTVVETSEDETNTSREESRDHQVTDRFSLQQELQNNQKASLDVDAKLHYGKTGGPYSFDLNTHGSLSKETAYREAREQVREQVEKATLKMQVQTRKLRSRSVTTEQTETNKHKFKNTTATAAVAKYFWVTQEKRGQLFSHGPRLHVDLLVPSPAMLFKYMEKKKRDDAAPKPPKGPPLPPTVKPKEITRENYVTTAAGYGVMECPEPPPPRPPHPPISLSYKGDAGAVTVDIPAGYEATSMTAESATWTGIGGVPVPNGYIAFQFGGGLVKKGGSNVTDVGWSAISAVGTSGGMISKYWATSGNSTLQVQINLTPQPVDLTPWQNSVYVLIMKKYQEDLEKYETKFSDYEAALKAFNAEQDDKIRGRHPFACEEIMRTEMKRSAIFMMCGEFDWPGVMNMDSELCHTPWPNRTKSDKATNEWYFFDRAFDWNLASFIFYDYFRNPVCKWIDSYEPDEPNFLFKAFLRAGYCRVMVPVSPGMEDDVRDYIQTGGLWGKPGVRPRDPNDTRWISVIEEIKHSHGCYQQDREGHIEAWPDPITGQFDSHIRVFTDRYWKVISSTTGMIDHNKIALELDHQIYIDGIEYRILSIVPDPNSAAYSSTTPNLMSWIIGLDRKIEFAPYIDPDAKPPLLKPYNWAVGAKYIGAPFHFELPTDLIWIGDQDNACLPCYPIDCVCEPEPAVEPESE